MYFYKFPNKIYLYYMCIHLYIAFRIASTCIEKKGRDLTLPKTLEYTGITDRLRTASLSNYSHPTGVVYRFYRAHLPTCRNSCVIEGKNNKYYFTVTPVNHTSWVAVVTPTDRPKSVRNRCLIELFCGVVCVVTLPF